MSAVLQTPVDPLADWRVAQEPYYRPVGDEVAQFQDAYALRLPLLLKGPPGCGKTRFVEHMAWTLGLPLVTVACHEDMAAGDLLGRWLIDADGTRWQDGPLTLAARHGALCYLDELIEARPDALTVLHPLADTRRELPLERNGELLRAHPRFQLVVSYNPQPGRELRPATRQRFVAMAFDAPPVPAQVAILVHEAGLEPERAMRLVGLAERVRALDDGAAAEAISMRMLVRAGQLMAGGMQARVACELALVQAWSDQPERVQALRALADALYP
ncbi:CbbQ/NirQ/NorQ/GpvN family protein [Pseudorhodoferax sp.]|uniref:CbbQ/NirQ/NorQ/GpvN family protein n=1 Tax=Pseudorhodoferax sp. TaxID=1993553 RepID=UPI002DD65DEF|nr:AAA family ATPase [Pseudorhodoferax sp.]